MVSSYIVPGYSVYLFTIDYREQTWKYVLYSFWGKHVKLDFFLSDIRNKVIFESGPRHKLFSRVFKCSNTYLGVRFFMYLEFSASAANAQLSKTHQFLHLYLLGDTKYYPLNFPELPLDWGGSLKNRYPRYWLKTQIFKWWVSAAVVTKISGIVFRITHKI